jgi:hypothetical protein
MNIFISNIDKMRNLIFCSIVMSVFLSGCFKEDFSTLELMVVDQAGLPVKDAAVTLHKTKTDWAEYLNEVNTTVRTNENGMATIQHMPDGKYFVNIIKGNETNRYLKNRTTQMLFDGNKVAETFTVRPYSEWEKILSGNDHIVWTLAPLMTPSGEPFLDYPVDTDMYLDGRWYDSNGRLGLWWFSDDESKIFYDYSASGAIVASDMISLTPELFKAKIDFFGFEMLIEMYPN